MTWTLLAGAAGALAAAGTVLALPRSGELPVPLRVSSSRLDEEVRQTADMLRDLGSVRAPLAGSRVRAAAT